MTPSSAQAYQTVQAYKSKGATDAVAEAEQKYDVGTRSSGVDRMRGLVSNLESAVEAVDPSVTGRTSGTFTTEGQRQALVSKERTPILGDLGKQQRALSIGEAGLSDARSSANNWASMVLTQDQQSYQRLLDQYNMALSAEQFAEQKRQFDEQQAEARRAASATSNLASLFAGGGGSTGGGEQTPTSTAVISNPQERASRILSGDINAQAASYKGLVAAASRGDTVAQQTIAIIDKIKPALKGTYQNITAQGGNVGYAPAQQTSSLVPSWVTAPTRSNNNPVGVATNLFKKWWNS